VPRVLGGPTLISVGPPRTRSVYVLRSEGTKERVGLPRKKSASDLYSSGTLVKGGVYRRLLAIELAGPRSITALPITIWTV
jgi:hypothetical protein